MRVKNRHAPTHATDVASASRVLANATMDGAERDAANRCITARMTAVGMACVLRATTAPLPADALLCLAPGSIWPRSRLLLTQCLKSTAVLGACSATHDPCAQPVPLPDSEVKDQWRCFLARPGLATIAAPSPAHTTAVGRERALKAYATATRITSVPAARSQAVPTRARTAVFV